MAKSKKLTLNTISTLDAQLNEKKTVYILGKYKHQLDKVFRPTKVQKLLIDYFELISQLKQQDVSMETVLKIPALLYVLVAKHFSDLPLQNVETLNELIAVSNQLYDTGVFEQLFDGENGFEPGEVKKLEKEIQLRTSKITGEALGELAYVSALNEVSKSNEHNESEAVGESNK